MVQFFYQSRHQMSTQPSLSAEVAKTFQILGYARRLCPIPLYGIPLAYGVGA